MDDDQMIKELCEIRRGRGLLAEDIHARIGPRLRLSCDISAGDPPSVARRKLVLCLTELCGRLPSDLRLAVLATLALHEETDQKFLHERMAWLAKQFGDSTRTARRRMDEGFRMLAEQITGAADTPGGRHNEYVPDGWYVESLKSMLRFDLEVPRLTEERRIVATVDELDEIIASLSVRPGPERGAAEREIHAEMVHGGEIIECHRPGPDYARFVIRLPRPLRLGERHEYAVQFTAYPREELRPYYLLTPLRRFDRFSLKVRFGAGRLPGKLWRLNGEHPRIADEFTPNDDLLEVDSIGEVQTEFFSLRQGLRYGVQWSF
ncbi:MULTISPECIES: hypothetical protein [unclassified Frankia]|uniref:hypothetical protein n=1 Tax=unclassified Frankia TaxID=2632575 RepID=UPI002025318A